MSIVIAYLTTEIRHRWQAVRATKDSGYSTEAVVATALLVTMAVIVIGILAMKVAAKATSINL